MSEPIRAAVEANGDAHRAGVVKAGLLTAGGFGTTLATILMVSGQWQIADGTTQFAIASAAAIVAVALCTVAVYVRRRV